MSSNHRGQSDFRCLCRQSLRLADGRLSPAAFSPVSRAAEAAAANARAAGLEPTKLRDKPELVASLLWQHQVAAGVHLP